MKLNKGQKFTVAITISYLRRPFSAYRAIAMLFLLLTRANAKDVEQSALLDKSFFISARACPYSNIKGLLLPVMA